MKRFSALCLVLVLLSIQIVSAADRNFQETAQYLIETVNEPKVSSIGGEWAVIGLARSESTVPQNWFDDYYKRVCTTVKEKKGVLHTRKNTEYSRVILALCAIGKNPESVEGYDLVKPLYDVQKTASQGLNGVIWALIALDCENFGEESVREEYLSLLLKAEKKNGGFALGEEEQSADADITAMALTALSRYRDRREVAEVIDRALSALSAMQTENGTFRAYGSESSESVAQVLTALSSLGISYTDSRFVKNGRNLLDVLMQFRCNDGSFCHTDESNLMATEQAFYALCAVDRLKDGKTSLFDMRKGNTKKHPDVQIPRLLYPNKTFSDVTAYRTAIETLASHGIVSGTGNGNFSPLRTVTRSEFCAVTVRALGLSKKSEKRFSDVPHGVWYEAPVQTAYRYGLVGGVSETRFSPDGTVTFEQACAILSRMSTLCGEQNTLSGEEIEKVLSRYSDGKNVAEWARADVAFCLKKGIFTRNNLLPQEAVLRGELCAAVYNLLKGAQLL